MAATKVVTDVAGNVWKIVAKVGDKVAEDDTIMIMESMKMETEIAAPVAGAVATIHVENGQTVGMGDPLVDLEPVQTPD